MSAESTWLDVFVFSDLKKKFLSIFLLLWAFFAERLSLATARGAALQLLGSLGLSLQGLLWLRLPGSRAQAW